MKKSENEIDNFYRWHPFSHPARICSHLCVKWEELEVHWAGQCQADLVAINTINTTIVATIIDTTI